MVLTAAMMCTVLVMPVVYFSLGGAEFHVMSYGVRGITGNVLVLDGVENDTLVSSTLSICVAVVVGVAALLPLVTLFLYRRRMVQVRLLAAEFVLLVGSIGMMSWYVWRVWRDVIAEMSTNFYFSFWPLLIVIALITNLFAVRGIMRDEILVRSADRIR
jgi:hypothetical protein